MYDLFLSLLELENASAQVVSLHAHRRCAMCKISLRHAEKCLETDASTINDTCIHLSTQSKSAYTGASPYLHFESKHQFEQVADNASTCIWTQILFFVFCRRAMKHADGPTDHSCVHMRTHTLLLIQCFVDRTEKQKGTARMQ